jgi:hypothetical protein
MQYKVYVTNVLWSPKDGSTIDLWKEDVAGQAKLSMAVPHHVPFHPIWGVHELKACEKERFISSKISKYIEF